MLDARRLTALHDEANHLWHAEKALDASGHFETLVLANHRANYDLWHEEDKARDPHATDAAIAAVKRSIDRLNQHRNDLVEQIDLAAVLALAESLPSQDDSAPLHSETPGLMLDRLSILSLKLYHTAEEAQRSSASESHRQRNNTRLAVLNEQRDDLAACLGALWQEVLAGHRRFKLYRQMKMYNDPSLNPVLYEQPKRPGG